LKLRPAFVIALVLFSFSLFAQKAAEAPKTFPSSTRTAWMSPDAFHLSIGMSEKETRSVVEQNHWKIDPGKEKNHLIVAYDEGKSLTLAFDAGVLTSARFEYIGFLPEVQAAFEEQRAYLREKLGAPKVIKARAGIVMYDRTTPNVMAVMSADHRTQIGKQGIGFLVVRYFRP
jgi:hypothetical protein